MSLLFLITFISDIKNCTDIITKDGFFTWALFSIADALWVRLLLCGGK